VGESYHKRSKKRLFWQMSRRSQKLSKLSSIKIRMSTQQLPSLVPILRVSILYVHILEIIKEADIENIPRLLKSVLTLTQAGIDFTSIESAIFLTVDAVSAFVGVFKCLTMKFKSALPILLDRFDKTKMYLSNPALSTPIIDALK